MKISPLERQFVPTAMATEAGHARAFEETERWVAGRLRDVPITRVFDATPVDYLRLPVWCAITPLAKDLMVHCGKGESPIAARLSAIMEAIERVSAETIAGERQRFASYDDLESEYGPTVLTPAEFDLPFESAYAPGRPISWVSGWDLLNEERVWVASDLAISPASEGVCLGAETNGLASGNTYVEATVHALYEVIERDAVACADYLEMWCRSDDLRLPPLRIIDPTTLTGRLAEWYAKLTALQLHAEIRDFTVDTGVPVFGVRLVDPCFPGGAREFHGYGASLEPCRAVIRAMTEAVQTHTAYFLGSRDEYESGPHIGDQQLFESRMWSDSPRQPWPHQTTAAAVLDCDLLTELRRLLQSLQACGCQRCVVVDLMNDDLQVPVVRVLVSGLAHPYGMSRRRPPVRLLRQLV